MKIGDKFDFEERYKIKCRCGLIVRLGRATHGEISVPAVLHDLPHCQEVEQLQLHDYIRWLKGEGHLPS